MPIHAIMIIFSDHITFHENLLIRGIFFFILQNNNRYTSSACSIIIIIIIIITPFGIPISQISRVGSDNDEYLHKI